MKKVMIILIIVLSLGVVYYLNSTINIDIAIKINNRDIASTVLNNDVYKDINYENLNKNDSNNDISMNENSLVNDKSLHKEDISNDEGNNGFIDEEINEEILSGYENDDYIKDDLGNRYFYEENRELDSYERNFLENDARDTKKESLNNEEVQVAFSEDAIQNLQESISLEDKAKLMKLVLANLSFSDINLLKGLLTGGITEEEKQKAMEFAQEKFNEDELEEFMQVYEKYVNLEQ